MKGERDDAAGTTRAQRATEDMIRMRRPARIKPGWIASRDAAALIALATAQVDEWKRQADAADPMKGDPTRLAKDLQRIERWRAAIALARGA